MPKIKGYQDKLATTMELIKKENFALFSETPDPGSQKKKDKSIKQSQEVKKQPQKIHEENKQDETKIENDSIKEISTGPEQTDSVETIFPSQAEVKDKEETNPADSDINKESEEENKPEEKVNKMGKKTDASSAEVVVIDKTPDLNEMRAKNFAGLSLDEIINCFINEIEKGIVMRNEMENKISFEEGVRLKWNDKMDYKTYCSLPEVHEIINIIAKRTPLTKYQVFERLILNGLKYTKFSK